MDWPRPVRSRYLLALLPPVVAFGLEVAFWSAIQPYAWLLFFPAVFVSAWIGGLMPGLVSTFFSAGIVWWYFMAPRYTSELGRLPAAGSVIVFCMMGVFISLTHEKLKKTARKAADAYASLRASEQNLAVTLNSIGDAVLATDGEGRVTRLNTVAEQLTGWKATDGAGLPVDQVFRIFNHKTREPATIPVATTLKEGIIHGLANDTVLISRDGKEYPIADSCAPIRRDDGTVIGAVLVFRDVSREYAAQAALRESAARIQTMFNSVADGIVTMSENGVVESFNPSAERMFGYAADEVIGNNVSMLMGQPFRGEHDGYLRRFRETGSGAVVGKERELHAQRKGGHTFPINLLVNEMYLNDQRHFIGIVRDLTDRRAAEDQLNAFFALSLDMLCISSSDGYFKRINPAFRHTLGWSEAEILSRPYLDFVHPDDVDATLREVQRQVAAGETVLHFENRYRHKDGSWRTLSWTSAPHGDGLMYATARDVTQAKSTERDLVAAKEKAEFANAAKDSFLATMSHEIRTPLTGMLGMLELLSLTRLDVEQRATLDTAWESARGLLRIVSDILDWSKIEEGKLELSLRAATLPRLLDEVVNTYSRVASSRDLVLRQHADPRLSAAHIVDPLRLSQVLNNFVSNALKFTQHGEVEVRADLLRQHESGETICFSVRDTGPGIPREVQARLFQRFRQESSDTARMYGGTGLGLAICRRLAELMDGQVALESEPGRGSTFSITLTLPVSGAPGEALPSPHPEVEQRSVKPLVTPGAPAPLILAVDDNPVNRSLLAKQLEFLGLRAETAENGERALEMWQGGRFAAVVTDCHMPEMDGYALARAIRRTEGRAQLRRTPIIAWTANALADEAERCTTAGMDELLVKPTGLPQLKMMLAKWLAIADPAGRATDSPAHGAAHAGATGPIDLSVLSLSVPDASEHMDVLADFRSTIVADHAKLRQILDQGDLVNVERTAHRMKGSSRMVGAHGLADACSAMEEAARNHEDQRLGAAMTAVGKAVGQIEAYLDGAVKPLQGQVST